MTHTKEKRRRRRLGVIYHLLREREKGKGFPYSM
jgi:hypothetical protein